MGVKIQFAPVEPDQGTGEVSHATAPTTYVADDVTNESTGEVSHQVDPTHEADDVKGESTGEVSESGPSKSDADWPPTAEDKAVADGESKAAPAKKAPAKAAAKKEA